MNLKATQKRDLIVCAVQLERGLTETALALASYANEPEHIGDAEEYLHGFTVLRQLIDAAEAEAKKILKVAPGGCR